VFFPRIRAMRALRSSGDMISRLGRYAFFLVGFFNLRAARPVARGFTLDPTLADCRGMFFLIHEQSNVFGTTGLFEAGAAHVCLQNPGHDPR